MGRCAMNTEHNWTFGGNKMKISIKDYIKQSILNHPQFKIL